MRPRGEIAILLAGWAISSTEGRWTGTTPRPATLLPVGRLRIATVVSLAGSAAVGHVVYPALLWTVSRGRRIVEPGQPAAWPPVTVLVPAYLEKGVIIAQKIDDIAANGYLGELEILVVADGDPDTAEVARKAGALVLLLDERGGKSQALNSGMAAASHEIVVITDANNHIEPGSIARLASHFQDEGVGAVAGEKVEGEDAGELLYWRFEGWIKASEVFLGPMASGSVGGLCGVRRSAWQDIPVDISNDDFWIALDLSERGHRLHLRAHRRRAGGADRRGFPAVGAANAGAGRRAVGDVAKAPASLLASPVDHLRGGWPQTLAFDHRPDQPPGPSEHSRPGAPGRSRLATLSRPANDAADKPVGVWSPTACALALRRGPGGASSGRPSPSSRMRRFSAGRPGSALGQAGPLNLASARVDGPQW